MNDRELVATLAAHIAARFIAPDDSLEYLTRQSTQTIVAKVAVNFALAILAETDEIFKS